MNEKLIKEIGDMCHIKYKSKFLLFGKIELTPEEILDTWEVKSVLDKYPELRRLCLDKRCYH